MRDELKNIANIEAYLAGELPPEQALIIEEKMAANAEFAENVNAQREITNHFKARAFAEAVQTHQVYYNKVRLLKTILIALGALLLIGFAVYQFIPSSELTSKENRQGSSEVLTAEKKERKLIQPTSEEERNEQKSLPTSFMDKQSKQDQDTVDNTVNLLSMRDALTIGPDIDTDIVDLIIDDAITEQNPPQNRTIWKIEDRFWSYYNEQILPIKVTSKNTGLNIEYSFTASRGTVAVVTLIDPTGKEYEIINMPEEFQDLEVSNQLELEYSKGTWKMLIHTVGQGYFNMKINSNE